MSTLIVGLDVKSLGRYVSCMKPEQCRAARGWLDWSQGQLAEAANVGLSTVRDFEKGRRTPIGNNMAAIETALKNAGIEFLANGISGPAN